MSDAFTGEIRIFPYNFAPQDWLPCDGQLCQITQLQALYSVIGNTYGGDPNKGTFALPNLSAAQSLQPNLAICGVGQAVGATTDWTLNMVGGSSTVLLSSDNLPSHTHQMIRAGGNWIASKKLAGPAAGTQVSGLYVDPATTAETLTTNPPDTTLAPAAVGTTGGIAAHDNRQPYLVCPFAICCRGTYPAPS
jgi:microcystin-dependent protein